MDGINLWARNPEAVRHAIELGEIVHLETASEELTDEFLLFAIDSRLLTTWSDAFPDPRMFPEIPLQVILASSLAARFAGIYSMRKTGFVLRSARVLGALGYSVEVIEPGQGLSSRGTSSDQPISGDVLRKLLVKMEEGVEFQPAAINKRKPTSQMPPVKVRDRPSRREVKQQIDRDEAEARGLQVAQELIAWYNQAVALSILEYGQIPRGRRLHIMDATSIGVPLEAGNYECSGVVRQDDGSLARGYKLLTLRTLLDTAGVMSGVAISAIQVHDLELGRPLLETSPAIHPGDLVIFDRAFIDGETISSLKRERRIDVLLPLRSDMLAYEEAVQIAEMEGHWQAHPSRGEQQIAFVRGISHVWDSCTVELNACVIRFYNEKKSARDYIVLVTTDLSLSAVWIVRHYEERPEIEQDWEQMKSGGWMLEKLTSTRYSEIVFYILTVVLSYSLYHLFANTKAGARFANKTRQAIAFEQLRTNRTHIIVYAKGHFEIFETLSFVHLVLRLPVQIQERLRTWMETHLFEVEKLE